MFNVHPLFVVAVLAIVLIVFGPGRLPEVGAAVGKGIREFRKVTNEIAQEPSQAANSSDPEKES